MDHIQIDELEVYAKHGVFPEENKLGQKFLISVFLYTDLREAGCSDDLTKSIHYGEISHRIKEFMETHTFQLIETAAEQLAAHLLTTTPLLNRLQLEIKKPWAPIGLPLNTVSVTIERQWHRVFIALGSNMGDRRNYLEQAVAQLKEVIHTEVVQVSSFINTPAYGLEDQADFLNGCVEIRTLLTPAELLLEIHKIEQAAGRKREIRWGPRTLDLDLLFYDQQTIDQPDLTIPHMEAHKRAFVLEPMLELAPYLRHPVYLKTISELYNELNQQEEKNG